MNITLGIIMLVTAAVTFLGGMFALRYKDKSHLITGFSAGAVIGVAFFELLPESMGGGSAAPLYIALGFLAYMVFDRLIGMHAFGDHSERSSRGSLRAVILCIHSFFDGIIIGVSFHVSPVLGTVVTAAVLAHDFSDGINTVSAILKTGQKNSNAIQWLIVDALAPVAGIASTAFFMISEQTLGILLAFVCGFFLYIGASDLIPESYHTHPTRGTTISTIVGTGVLYIVIRLVG